MEGWQPTRLDGGFVAEDEDFRSDQLGRALDVGQSPQAPDVEVPRRAEEVVAVTMIAQYDDPLAPEEQADPECEEYDSDEHGMCSEPLPMSPASRTITWVHVEALPEIEGDDLVFDRQTAQDIDVESMKRWCESNSHCVGFAHWAGKRKSFHIEGFVFPKERHTGFDERTVVWVKDKYPGQVWHWYYIKERAHSNRVDIDGPSTVVSSTSLINANAAYVPLADGTIPEYLLERGFAALDTITWALAGPSEWAHRMPVVRFAVRNHEEAGSHTWYTLEACFYTPDCTQRQAWKAPRRLLHVRQFRDHLRSSLGKEGYNRIFTTNTGERVPFAARGGVPGTTLKLDAWLCALANTINDGATTPAVVAATLHFLRAPPLADDAECERSPSQVVDSSPVCSPMAASDVSPHPCQPT